MALVQVRVRDLVEGLYDGPHATPPPATSGPIFLGIQNITDDGHLALDDVRHIDEGDFERWTKRVVPQAGDIVFTYEATLNRYAIIPTGFRGCLGRRLALLRVDKSKTSSRYLHYAFFSPEWRATVSANTLIGATVDRVPLSKFLEFPIRVHAPREQERIVEILSAYDDLIENNTHRIRLLEEMARLAFALAESRSADAPMRPLGDVVDSGGGTVRTGPFGSQLHESDYTPEGTPVVMPKNMIAGRIDTSSIARVPDDVVQKVEQHKLRVGDIVYGRRGDIGRHAFIGRHQDGWICGTGCLRISLGKGPLHSRYLHEHLGKPAVVSSIGARAVGATMPNLNTSILRSIEVPVPSAATQRSFADFALPNDDLVENLRAKNDLLRAQRELLLPRLITGEIELAL